MYFGYLIYGILELKKQSRLQSYHNKGNPENRTKSNKRRKKRPLNPENRISSQSTLHLKAVGPSVRGFVLCIAASWVTHYALLLPSRKISSRFSTSNDLEHQESLCLSGYRSIQVSFRRDGWACPSSSSSGET